MPTTLIRVEPFAEVFVAVANNHLTGSELIEKLRLDAQVGSSDPIFLGNAVDGSPGR
jgi:hypothetical protein